MGLCKRCWYKAITSTQFNRKVLVKLDTQHIREKVPPCGETKVSDTSGQYGSGGFSHHQG